MLDVPQNPPTTLSDAIALLPTAADEWTPRLSLGPCPQDAVMLAAATGTTLAGMLAHRAEIIPGADDKLAAADLIGTLGWTICQVIAGLTMTGLRLLAINPAAVGLVRRRIDWESDGESGTGWVFDMVLDPAGVTILPPETGSDADTQSLLSLTEALFAPLIAEIHAATKLGQAALWRLVGDSATYAFLDSARTLGCEDKGMEIGRAMVGQRGTKLFSKQTGYVLVSMPENPAPGEPCLTEWFRIRGGCCRYYTVDGNDYCTTCVLRDTESTISLLRNHLHERMIAAT